MHELIKCPGRVDKVARMFKPGIKVPGLGYHMVPTLYAMFCFVLQYGTHAVSVLYLVASVDVPYIERSWLVHVSNYVRYRFVAV